MIVRLVPYLFLALIGCGGVRPAEEALRPVADGLAVSKCQQSFNAGLAALASGDAQEAVGPLQQAVDEEPACTLDGRGLAAEWLGVALERTGQTPEAVAVWKRAVQELPLSQSTGAIAGRWASATQGEALAERSAFAALLSNAGEPLAVSEPRARALAQIAAVVPDSVRRGGFVSGDPRRGLAAGGGKLVLDWWRTQDPLPGTAQNERVGEHSKRVRYALGTYPDPESVLGYDARGELHVRFGAPSRKHVVMFNEATFLRELAQSGLSVSRSDFPDNEIWAYGGNTEARTYVLVERDGAYRLGTSQDLIPPSLRTIVGQTARDQQRSLVALAAARTIYSQLATFETGYGVMWADLQRYVESGRRFQRPGAAIRQFNQQMRSAESGLRQRRIESEPPSESTIAEDIGTLDAQLRVARFLSEDGRAETEIWWAASGVPGQRHALVGTLVTDARTAERGVADSVRVAWDGDITGGAIVPARPVTARCEGACPLAFQLDARGPGDPGVLLRTFVWEGTPEPLATDRLELSDLLPLDATTDIALVDGSVAVGQPLSLRFEAYGLEEGQGPAQFVIEYELVLRRFGNLLRRTREEAREGDLTSFTRGSQTEQFLLLRTDDWDQADEVDITIRIRDIRANAEVERTITLDVLR